MSTLTQITAAIKIRLEALPDVDHASIDGYLPPVNTQKVALVMPAMGMSGTVGAPVGLKTRLVHRIPCEFWVKVNNGDLVATMRRGREICLDAAAELQSSAVVGSALDGTVTSFGDGAGSDPFVWSVDDNIIDTGKAAYIRATLFVTVTEWVVLTD